MSRKIFLSLLIAPSLVSSRLLRRASKKGSKKGIFFGDKPHILNVFSLGEYKRDTLTKRLILPNFVQLNLKTWERHLQVEEGKKIIVKPRVTFLNDNNIMRWIPDMPTEYFRLPYSAAKSDMIRYGVLFHNGGLYLDTDILIKSQPHEELLRALSGKNDGRNNVTQGALVDLFSYEGFAQKCEKGTFSSNFMGANKKSKFMQKVWEAQKKALTNHCHTKEELSQEKICCILDLMYDI